MATAEAPYTGREESTHFANPAPLAPTDTNPRPQLSPVTGFPQEGAVRYPGQLSGFAAASSETSGASHMITPGALGDRSAALSPEPSPNFLGGRIIGPAVPRWEEGPNMKIDTASLAPSPNKTSETISSDTSSY